MNSNNTVYVLVGQRGAGKSVYAEKILSQQPEFLIISRDAILVELFGSTDLSPYTGQSHQGDAETKRLLCLELAAQRNLKLVLDYWTGGSRDRQNLHRWLREHGAARVIALYFVTPLPLVNEWFWKKPGIAKVKEMGTRKDGECVFFSESAPSHDYEMFHKLASDIDLDGFDEVIRINPLGPVITL